MTLLEKLDALIAETEKATKVNKWYSHPWEGTVRGPFHRWFTCAPVDERYQKHVASVADDTEFAAAAMNNYPAALRALKKAVERLQDSQIVFDEAGKLLLRDLFTEALAQVETELG